MISRIHGKLAKISEQYALIENAGVFYEVMVPSALAERLKNSGKVGQQVSFDTIYYIEAGDKRSNFYPKLVGFTDPVDREFFSLFTQVQGMGVRRALKCLILPIKEIATAIETRDSSQLCSLPGVGGRLADKIIAELNGKTAKFALSKTEEPLAKDRTHSPVSGGGFRADALEVLLQLQYSRNEAQRMIDSAIKSNPEINDTEDLISFIFKNEISAPPLKKRA
jgi:Holliday junction DNA helicase RuvA